MTRVAAIDCGTNSLRLLVADIDPRSGDTVQLDRRTTIVRLGQDIDRTGVFADAALARTFATLADYARIIDGLEVEAVRLVATSAARDAGNRERFLAGVRARIGVDAEILTGAEEARLSYDGATRRLVDRPEIAPPILVVDIGGGSTEFVIRLSASDEIDGESVDVGSVRLTERHLVGDPPTKPQVDAVVADVDAALASLRLPLDTVGTLVGVAGTITTLAAMVLDLPTYDRERVNEAWLASSDVLATIDRVVAMSVARRRALPFMHPDRADVIGAGALVLGGVVRRIGLAELLVSSHDILDGVAWSLLPRG
ncbi:MAG: exopolyphosphatase [Nocardioidaceae bacterium]